MSKEEAVGRKGETARLTEASVPGACPPEYSHSL
jgi:hypothetical protein